MKIEEFPQFMQKLGTQKGPIDPVHILYHKIFRSGYLHFGYWSDDRHTATDIEGLMGGFRSAQGRFADELLACIPRDAHRLLDVGAGLGRFSGDLLAQGHAVTAVTPCAYQAEQITNQYPNISVAHGRFQDIGLSLPSAGFDIILFSESFRYIPLPEAFRLFDRLLTPTGYVVIADWFTHDVQGAKHGHDHNHHSFRKATFEQRFSIVSERDVTKNVLPTVKLAYDVLCEFYLPLAGYVLAKFAQKRPRLYKFCLGRIIGWLERKVLPQLPGRCDPDVFAAHYKYFFFVLRRAAPVS